MRLGHPLIEQRRPVTLGILIPQPRHFHPTNIRHNILQLQSLQKPIHQRDLIHLLTLRMRTLALVRLHIRNDFFPLLRYEVLVLFLGDLVLLGLHPVFQLLKCVGCQFLELAAHFLLDLLVCV